MLYVAYDLDVNTEYMNNVCPNARKIGIGDLYGWRLVFNSNPDIVRDSSCLFLPVMVWDVPDSEVCNLDNCKCYPRYYAKESVDVDVGGRSLTAFSYTIKSCFKGMTPPDSWVFDNIEKAYVKSGITTRYLYDALNKSQELHG